MFGRMKHYFILYDIHTTWNCPAPPLCTGKSPGPRLAGHLKSANPPRKATPCSLRPVMAGSWICKSWINPRTCFSLERKNTIDRMNYMKLHTSSYFYYMKKLLKLFKQVTQGPQPGVLWVVRPLWVNHFLVHWRILVRTSILSILAWHLFLVASCYY